MDHAASASVRPEPGRSLTGAELLRWYWLKTELVAFARELGVSTAGGKRELTDRLVATLDGRPPAPPRPARRALAAPLTEPLTRDTVLPAGQRCTQQLRAYLVSVIGPGFTFDEPIREFIANGDGRTLGELVEHHAATRGRMDAEIAPQFELNRFLRSWHYRHPGGRRADALAAWRDYRALPIDARPPDRADPGQS